MSRSRPALTALLATRRTHRAPPVSPYTICTDGLEGENYWGHSATGPDDVCAISAAQHHAGTHSLQVATRTTGAAPGDTIVAFRWFPWVESHHLLESVWLYVPDPAKLQVLWWWIQLNNLTHYYHPHIAWWMPTGEASYWNAAGLPTAMPALDHVWVAGTWTHLTLEIDTQSKCYVAATLDAASADLSGIPFQQGVAATSQDFQAELGVQAIGAAAATAYLDDLTITATVP